METHTFYAAPKVDCLLASQQTEPIALIGVLQNLCCFCILGVRGVRQMHLCQPILDTAIWCGSRQ